ncbi:MAG: CinA family protein, partial [Plesiomonas shigelloides]
MYQSLLSLSEAVGARLTQLGWKIAAAESCTGGGIMAALTD